ncbi:MAG TPA: hypothetical protein VGO21_02405, partial [Candidatus Paceibacterota bacterium]|nr:hypothetical protein [Candidatus Paceibacterota bacterium]
VDKLSSSLADNIQNSTPRKIFTIGNIKTTQNETHLDIQKYSNTLSSLYPKTPNKYSVLEILQKFIADGNIADVSALSLLDPIIKRDEGLVAGMLKMEVPESLAVLHLNLTNSVEKVLENLNDIKLYDSDPIVSLTAISQYENNSVTVGSEILNIEKVIAQKLKI